MRIHSRLVYITFDLDYWNYETEFKSAYSIIKRVLNMYAPIKIYSDHKDVVADIPLACGHIINVDRHDDIFSAHNLKGEFRTLKNDNWANFVKQKSNAIYEWRRPKNNPQCCDLEEWPGDPESNVWEKRDTGWGRTVSRVGVASLPWTRAYALSFVISEEFTTTNVLLTLLPLLNHPRIVPTDAATAKIIRSYCSKPAN